MFIVKFRFMFLISCLFAIIISIWSLRTLSITRQLKKLGHYLMKSKDERIWWCWCAGDNHQRGMLQAETSVNLSINKTCLKVKIQYNNNNNRWPLNMWTGASGLIALLSGISAELMTVWYPNKPLHYKWNWYTSARQSWLMILQLNAN